MAHGPAQRAACGAWVGSRDFAQEQFDHVSQARRQPGSTFKPFVYGAAFEQGIDPADTFIDQPVAIRSTGGDVWTPTDGDAAQRPADDACATAWCYSKNTITAQVMQQVGPARVAQLAQRHGRARRASSTRCRRSRWAPARSR